MRVQPFGANFEDIPPPTVVTQRRRAERCRLLFLGVKWHRKGGDIAYETLLQLEELGISTELTVCGCAPPTKISHPHLRFIPFLNKNDEKQRKELEQLYLASDFFLLPTRSDCTPIVFCEANAFGLPIITTRTGGIPEMVKDGENGFVLPLAARGDAYARVIADIYQDEQRYAALIRSSRAAYDKRLNWDTWAIAMRDAIDEIIEYKSSSRTSIFAAERGIS